MMRFPLALALICVLTTGCKNESKEAGAAPPTAKEEVSAAVNTVTETQTATETSTVTLTQTQTQVSTVTSTVTVSSVATVTQVQVSTVTRTVTETQVASETNTLETGKYSSEACFYNNPASEGMGQNIYTRSSIQFGAHGRGTNSFELYDDAQCRHSLMQSKLKIRYSATVYFGRLLLIAVDQYNDPSDKKSVVRYWIPALKTKEGLLIDIDGAKGARGPFFSEPSEAELKSLLEGMENRAVLFEKAEEKGKPQKK